MDDHSFVVMTDEWWGLWPLPYLYSDMYDIMSVVIFCETCLFVGVRLPKSWFTV